MPRVDFQQRFTLILHFLRLYGVLYQEDKPFLQRFLYKLYSAFNIILYNLHTIALLINIYFNITEMEVLSSVGLISLTKIMTNLKIYIFIIHRKAIEELMESTKAADFQPKSFEQQKKAESILKVYDWMFTFMKMSPVVCMIFWSLYPILESEKNRELPFAGWYPFDYKKTPMYQIIFAHQNWSTIIMSQLHINVEFLVFYLMVIVIIQFDFLSDNIKNIYEDLVKELRNVPTDSLEFQCAMETRLIYYMEKHKTILHFFDDIYTMMNILAVGQLMLSTTAICLTMLQMSMIKMGSTAFMALIAYEFAMLEQLFLYCFWGNQVMKTSESLSLAAFHSYWLESPIPYRKKLTFFIHATRKPLILHAIGFFKINLETFTGVLRVAYQFYALLHHMNTTKQH